MSFFKLIGDANNAIVDSVGQMSQGIGYPLRDVEQDTGGGSAPVMNYGSLYWTASAATANETNTWIKAAGTTTDVSLKGFGGKVASGQNNRLVYTAAPAIHVHGVCSFSMSLASGAGDLAQLGVYKNGTTRIEHSIVRRTVSSTAEGTGALHFDLDLVQNDFIELWVVVDSPKDITITAGYMYMMTMPI